MMTRPCGPSPPRCRRRTPDEVHRLLEGRRVGVVWHHTPRHPPWRFRVHPPHRYAHRPGIDVAAAFGPEHGFRGDLPDGEKAEDGQPRTGIPVHSLYGTLLQKPTAAQLDGLEAVVFDIQDSWARYTYLSTLILVMEACAAQTALLSLIAPTPTAPSSTAHC